jgi:hypothetical protein
LTLLRSTASRGFPDNHACHARRTTESLPYSP